MPSYVTPSPIDLLLTYKMSTSYTNSLLRLGVSTIWQSDWSRVSWAISQDLEFCQLWNLGWEFKYHNNSPFRVFYSK